MPQMPALTYRAGSLVEPFARKELRAFEKWLRKSGYDAIRFDPAYIKFLERNHGGSPVERYFHLDDGTNHVLERFLNYLPSDSNNPLKQYNAESIWSLTSDRMGMFLIPCAELFAGDLLCFDHAQPGPPRMVVWDHEQSKPDAPPVTTAVANSFTEFLIKLHG